MWGWALALAGGAGLRFREGGAEWGWREGSGSMCEPEISLTH